MPFLLFILFILVVVLSYFILASILFRDEIKATFDRDPAATSLPEVLFTYAGLQAIIFYRVAHKFYSLKVPLLPRFLSQFARLITGIEIHPGASIGKGIFIDHGMGVVVGETSVIGHSVTLFQGVTLGGTGKERGKRHPNIGNNVVIGTGAKVLGNITVGNNSYIGANAVVIKDIPPNSTVVGVPGRITKQDGKKMDVTMDHIHTLDPIFQDIEELKKRLEKLEST